MVGRSHGGAHLADAARAAPRRPCIARPPSTPPYKACNQRQSRSVPPARVRARPRSTPQASRWGLSELSAPTACHTFGHSHIWREPAMRRPRVAGEGAGIGGRYLHARYSLLQRPMGPMPTCQSGRRAQPREPTAQQSALGGGSSATPKDDFPRASAQARQLCVVSPQGNVP